MVFEHERPGRYRLGQRTVVLIPMLAGDRAFVAGLDNSDLVWFGYPQPGCGSLWLGPREISNQDPLAVLLGLPRTRVLRFLSRPATMQEIAKALHYAPNTITFHCEHLERGGLLVEVGSSGVAQHPPQLGEPAGRAASAIEHRVVDAGDAQLGLGHCTGGGQLPSLA